MARTCCPQYTIRLDARTFKPDRKHRAVINRFNRFLETGSKDIQPEAVAPSSSDNIPPPSGKGGISSAAPGEKAKGKGKAGPYDWMHELHKWESSMGVTGKKQFQVSRSWRTHQATPAVGLEMLMEQVELVPAKSTPASFDLYKRYQVAVHNDPPDKVTERGFRRFLCDSPLLVSPPSALRPVADESCFTHRYSSRKILSKRLIIQDEPIPYPSPLPPSSPLPRQYGSYHLLYKVDARIIGISVIDILPSCVSSVYFIWDPDWAWASLGKLSALWEASLSRRIEEAFGNGRGGGGWVYMGECWVSAALVDVVLRPGMGRSLGLRGWQGGQLHDRTRDVAACIGWTVKRSREDIEAGKRDEFDQRHRDLECAVANCEVQKKEKVQRMGKLTCRILDRKLSKDAIQV